MVSVNLCQVCAARSMGEWEREGERVRGRLGTDATRGTCQQAAGLRRNRASQTHCAIADTCTTTSEQPPMATCTDGVEGK